MRRIIISKYLTREERKSLLQKNDWKASSEVFMHWLWIIGTFAFVYLFPNPLVILLALFVLGGKQLACAILMHDTGHRAVFQNPKVNDWVGQYLGAFPIFQDMLKYRPYHNIHHIHTGHDADPDLLLTRSYPASRRSMQRKLIRDFTGQTGIKAFVGIMMMKLGYLEYNLGGHLHKIDQSGRSWRTFFNVLWRNMAGPLLTNLLMLVLLSYFASPYLYLLWIGAYFTTFQFVLRIRSMAEHAMVHDTTDPYANTRTTYANWWEKMLFSPYYVNYHVEHHLMMAVPSYNLPKMHKILKDRGFYEKGVLAQDYWSVFRLAIR